MPPASHPTRRAPRWQRRPGERPEEILDAALHVFGEKGFARTRLEEVARRAGVSKGTLYLYFDSKEELFRAMARARVSASVAQAEELVRSFEGPTTDLLAVFIRRYWEKMMLPENLRLARVVLFELSSFPELARFYYTEVMLRMRGLIQSIIDRGIARGEFRSVHPRFAAQALQTLCVNLAQAQHHFRAFDPAPLSDADMVSNLIDFFVGAVASRPGPATKGGA